MLSPLSKIFVRRFYSTHAGFFFLLFFVFFGAVQGGSLVKYHLSLMQSFFDSVTVLLLVFFCWLLYHIKCTGFFLRIIKSAECQFLFNLQALSPVRLWTTILVLYIAVYVPVLVYAVVVFCVGIRTRYVQTAAMVLLYQLVTTTACTSLLYYRLTHWQHHLRLPSFRFRIPKQYLFYLLFYFTTKRKWLLLIVKTFSILLLYIVLVGNKDHYDADAFLLFYLVILMAHSTLPFYAVDFFEKEMVFGRNMPLSLFMRGLAYLLPYCLLMLPEAIYLVYAGAVIPPETQIAYLINFVASFSLLTAFLYSEAKGQGEYLKAAFGLFFLSIFMLHAEAYWIWIGIQFSIAVVLFSSGYYRYEKEDAVESKNSDRIKRPAKSLADL